MPLLSTRGATSAKGFGLTQGGIKVTAEYVIYGGGAAGGGNWGQGGGAGGVQSNYPSPTGGDVVVPGTYPVTVGAGGSPVSSVNTQGGSGTDSIWNSITAGGGMGGAGNAFGNDTLGKSGTPQSFAGGQTVDNPVRGGGGGGSGGAGQPGASGKQGGPGSTYAIYAAGSTTYAGGGGGGGREGTGPGGPGGGGSGAGGNPGGNSQPGTASTGSGGGGAPTGSASGGGATGLVTLRFPAKASPLISVTPGTNTKTSAPNGDAVCTFTVGGTVVIA
jgi:hypothetical protein